MPNRRSTREFALSLYRVLGHGLLTPDIRALGDVDDTDGADVLGASTFDLPPAVSTPRRRGALAKLIQRWRVVQGEPELPPASALASADELASLLDQSAIAEHVDWSLLDTLELADNLAEHWKACAGFLKIVADAWPNWLSEQGAMDPMARRRAAAEALATRWETTTPTHPIVIAGSTGSTAASRRLMGAALKLPKGLVVLPGLDADLGEDGWPAVRHAPSHPQFAFSLALRDLGVAPADVRPWPVVTETPAQIARRRLINESLAPAESTGGWNDRLIHLAEPASAASLVKAGLSGVRLVEAEDESEEALAAALLLRQTIETPGATAALVAPDPALGRRVSAILERWGVDVAASAGEPLHRTQSASFLLILMRWAQDPAEPVHLLAALKHPLCRLNRTRDELDALVSWLERLLLRGPRKSRTLADLAARARREATRLEKKKDVRPDELERAAHFYASATLIDDLDTLHAPFPAAFAAERIEGDAAAEACSNLAMALATCPDAPNGESVWAGREGTMAAQFLEQLATVCAELGGVDADFWPQFADSIAQDMQAAPDTAEHPRIAIWGPLEARLQSRHRVILAGLNEGSWPRQPGADGFLNRKLRKDMGFADPDERIGLSAHDFAQMANAPEVILLRAKRVEDKPAVASRWLWRLRTLAAGGLGEKEAADNALAFVPADDPLQWAKSLRDPGEVVSAKPPAPRPEVKARALDGFSPSRVGRLIRDPYADYAQRILGIEAMRRVGEPVDARERGTAVHAAIQEFEDSDGKQNLDSRIVEKLIEAGASEDLIELERPLWLRAAKVYLAWVDARAHKRRDKALEKRAEWTFESAAPGGKTELNATADRVELLEDGTLAIIDFKTGDGKKSKQLESGIEPQLPLEAYLATQASFGQLKPAMTSELIYFKFSTSAGVMKGDNGTPLKFTKPASEVADDAFAGLCKMIESYANPDQPYRSKPRAEFTWDYGDYDRLARRKEWTIEDGAEE